MKYIIALLCFTISAVSFSQNELSEDNAKMYVDVFFDGFHKGDSTKMKSVISPNLRIQNVYVNKEGSNVIAYVRAEDFIKVIAERSVEQKWEERILDYKVTIDGNLAHVWTPYQFYVGGEFRYCGANSFTLVSTDDGWKILNIIDSRRIAGCLD